MKTQIETELNSRFPNETIVLENNSTILLNGERTLICWESPDRDIDIQEHGQDQGLEKFINRLESNIRNYLDIRKNLP